MTEQTQEQPQVQLNLSDLVIVLETMNLAASRGAFKPDEFATIGPCYERIFSFLRASGIIQPQQPAAAEGQQPQGDPQ
jgi:hypothetical protein